MILYHAITVYVILTVTLQYSLTFVLDRTDHASCLVPSDACVCADNNIYCQGLDTMPDFQHSDIEYTTVNIYIYDSYLHSIKENAFENVNSTNATDIHISLKRNDLSYIDTDAFVGIEDAVSSVDLSHNNLTSLPEALGKLTSLIKLHVGNNPLASLDIRTMTNIGRSLKCLTVSLNHFMSWPNEMHALRLLESLSMYTIPFRRLDFNAFHGFEATLKTLQISNSSLERIPFAVCHLTHLETFTFDGNTNLQTVLPVFEPCGKNMSSVTFLNLIGNNLKRFPDMLNTFTSLKTLAVTGNQIRTIDGDVIPYSNSVTTIFLNDNWFSRIPYALNKLTSLQNIHVSGNNITSIEDPDVEGLSNLQTLHLSGNPIEYVSNAAFANNRELSDLEFRYTSLDHIPRALTTLQHLSTLRISGKPIECTCDMAYLTGWNVSSINIAGNCEASTETLKYFLMNVLPNCPP